MEAWHTHFHQLESRSHFNMTLNTSAVREATWTATSRTRRLIASLQLQQVQTIRTMHLTIGAISLALVLITVYRIVSDARRAAALQVTVRKRRFNALHNVHTAETFPLALASGTVLQQIIFVSVQGTSLHSVLSTSCRGLAMITFPAIFIIGYITLVFGIEMAWRSLRSERFAPRGKWNTTICIAAVSFMLLLTWIPTVIWPMSNRCFGGLIWYPMRYDLLALVLLIILVSSCLLMAAIISIQLMRTSDLDSHERISASRMSYYLIVVSLIYILVMPVEVQSLQKDFMNALAASRIAEISLFGSGLIITFFHLFLRTNATRMVIRPMEEVKAPQQQRPRIRFFGPSDLEMQISGPLALHGGRRLSSSQGLIDVGPEKNRADFDADYYLRPERAVSPASTKLLSPIDPTKWPLPPDLTDVEEKLSGHQRGQSSYSLFPTRAEEVPRLPATVYNPNAVQRDSRVSKLALRRFTRRSSTTNVSEAFDFLTKPRAMFSEHRRGASTDSSATVQIGLRFSVAPATLAAAKCTRLERNMPSELSAPTLSRNVTDSSGTSLGLPIQSPSARSTASSELLSPSQFPSPPPRPRLPSPARTPAFPMTPSQNSSAYLQAQREKVLPAIPPHSPQPPPMGPMVSGLRMNPVTPAGSVASPTTASGSEPGTPGRQMPSPTARIPLGNGTMSRAPPRNGWI